MSLTTECRTRWSVHPVVLASLLIASCSGDAETPASVDPPSDETAPTTLAISADLFNGSVSFLDLDALVASDGTRDELNDLDQWPTVAACEGTFAMGEVVRIENTKRREVGRGVCRYAAAERRLAGLRTISTCFDQNSQTLGAKSRF